MHHLPDLLLAPFDYPFMMRALVAVVLVGAVCAVLGTYVMLRGLAFLGDALAHAILPGLAVGYLVLLRVAYMANVEVGTIFAIFVYVWHVMEKLDMMPTIVQQLMRLKDIRRRIEAGNSVDAIGAVIHSTDPDKRG